MRFVSLLFTLTLIGSLLVQSPLVALAADATPTPAEAGIGRSVRPFELKDYRGRTYRSDAFKQPVLVVVFLAVDCPLAQLYGSRLSELADRFPEDRVAVIGVNSNRHDNITELAAYARKYGFRPPLLKDAGNRVADAFAAERTPEAFVLDAQRKIRYRGRIDDQYGVGYARDDADNPLLQTAIESVLAGREVATPVTRAVGCHIGRIAEPDPQADITYSSHIAKILNRHCVECHRAGEIAPFTLTDYDEVVGWAETIDEVVRDNRMPPWHADPKIGEFRNTRGMTAEEKRLISAWVDAGAPLGDAGQVPPPPPPITTEWRLPRRPDRVIKMRERPFRVPADGIVEYQYFVVDPELKEDTWVSAAEVIPGNRRVVHHAIVFIKPPKPEQMRGFGWLSAYVPGQALLQFPPGMARKIPAGSKLIFQMHYTPVGEEQDDTTKIGLVFADPATVDQEAFTMLVLNQKFEIPPHVSDFPVKASLSDLPVGSQLLAVGPHMHVRGKSFRFDLVQDGQRETLLSVPKYDFNWQHSYAFKEPVPIREGMRLECTGIFDNSDANLVNPDPSQTVRWGDQTWQEMLIGYLELSAPVDVKLRDPAAERRRAEAEKSADEFLARFDRDRDGRVASRETPSAFSTFAFRRIDTDGDKFITREEAIDAALEKQNR